MKELLKQSGIYQIRNTVNGKIYVGSAKSLKARRWLHFGHLNRGTHHSQPLQRAYKKYGKDAFVFEPLITCVPSMLIHYEQQFMDQWKPEYNVCKVAGSCLGRKHTDEARANMRKAQEGRVVTDEARKNQSMSQKTRASMRRYTHDGKTLSLSEWSQLIGVTIAGLHGRIYKRGWSVEQALTTLLEDKQVTYNGLTKPLTKWADDNNLKSTTLDERLKRGWGMEKALTTPPKDLRREYKGVYKLVSEWAIEYNLNLNTLKRRLRQGWGMDRALTQPVEKQDHTRRQGDN